MIIGYSNSVEMDFYITKITRQNHIFSNKIVIGDCL